jgi:hypothetical protein
VQTGRRTDSERCRRSKSIIPNGSVLRLEPGLSLHQMMRGIKGWAETHMDDVLANREAHDARMA